MSTDAEETTGGLGTACWIAGLMAAAGAAGANRQLVGTDLGFLLVALGGVIGGPAAAGLLVLGPRRWATILAGAVPGLVMLAILVQVNRVPMTADVSTDPRDPPAIAVPGAPPGVALPHGPDALAALVGPYADLRPRLVPGQTPEQVAPALRRILAEAGLEVGPDPRSKTATLGLYLHALARTPVMRFEDDVVARLRAAEGGTRVDMRSQSRVGKSDLGANHARLVALLARIDAALGAKAL